MRLFSRAVKVDKAVGKVKPIAEGLLNTAVDISQDQTGLDITNAPPVDAVSGTVLDSEFP